MRISIRHTRSLDITTIGTTRQSLGVEPRKSAMETLRVMNDILVMGTQVEKYTGDYQIKGEIRSVFRMKNGAVRYVVEHKAEGGGSFLHIYSEKNIRAVKDE